MNIIIHGQKCTIRKHGDEVSSRFTTRVRAVYGLLMSH